MNVQPSTNPRGRQVTQALVVLVCLAIAHQIALLFHVPAAGAVLCLASLATVVICARLGWRHGLLGVAGVSALSVPAVLSPNSPLLATTVLTATALALGVSARWQLKPAYWLLVVSLGILITKSPLPLVPAPAQVAQLALALLSSGALSLLLQAKLLPPNPAGKHRTMFAVAHSWRRSVAHGLMLAVAAVVTTPIALQHHWHTTGLWLIVTPFLVIQPIIRESWSVALHRSLGTLAGVLLVMLLALTLPSTLPLVIPAVSTAVLTVLIAAKHGHRALMITALTATIVLFNSNHNDLLLMADKRVLASTLGIAISLSIMGIAHLIERHVLHLADTSARASVDRRC